MNKFFLVIMAFFLLASIAFAEDLGNLNSNPYDPDSVANPYGQYGSKYSPESINNPYGKYGSPYSPNSVNNPYATDAPRIYDSNGNYRGKLSANQYDPDSTSNPYGRYGSKYSPESINNPYGAGNPYSVDSPNNPYGNGLEIKGSGKNSSLINIYSPTNVSNPMTYNSNASNTNRYSTISDYYNPLDTALEIQKIRNARHKLKEQNNQMNNPENENSSEQQQKKARFDAYIASLPRVNNIESLALLWNPDYPDLSWNAPIKGLLKIETIEWKNEEPSKFRLIKNFTQEEIERFIVKAKYSNPNIPFKFPAGRYSIVVDLINERICNFKSVKANR